MVAEYSPMKRGLKGGSCMISSTFSVVAEYSPMKRGLKGNPVDGHQKVAVHRCRVFPDEEGTERAFAISYAVSLI